MAAGKRSRPKGPLRRRRQWQADQALRAPMRSPGRPTVWRRDVQVLFWQIIAGGATSEDAGVLAGVSAPVGSRLFREGGGMSPISLAPSSGRYLSFAEREEISILKAAGAGVREIARQIGRDPGTISRELRRNAGVRAGCVTYRASTAQWHAERRASRPKAAKLIGHEQLREYVQDRLAGTVTAPDGTLVPGPAVAWIGRRHGPRKDRRWSTAWSPEQIAHRLPIEFPDDLSMRVSHEAIYQGLYIKGRGTLRRELSACLRTGRALRVPRARTRGRGKKFIAREDLIDKRPPAEAPPGKWTPI